MLGTTFGGNHLACVAALSVLEVLQSEGLVANANQLGTYVAEVLSDLDGVKEVRGKGLMIGAEFDFPVADLRKKLLFDHQIFTGSAANKNTLRLLPPLSVTKQDLDQFFEALKQASHSGRQRRK